MHGVPADMEETKAGFLIKPMMRRDDEAVTCNLLISIIGSITYMLSIWNMNADSVFAVYKKTFLRQERK